MLQQNRLKKGQVNLLTLKSKIAGILSLILLITNTQCFASELTEADSASVSSVYLMQSLCDKMSQRDGVSYIHYNLSGASNNINNKSYITSSQKYLGLREPHKFGYRFDGWYLDRYFTQKADVLSYEPGKGYVVYAKWVRIINNRYSVENYKYRSETGENTILLKNCDYDFINEVNIPGMPGTKEEDFLNNYIFSESQCPQGLCITDEYILVTSYSEDEGSLGELMVFSRENGEYLVTLGMDADSHLGGIAYDGENVWVCNSHDMTIERIAYDFIQLMATQNSKQVVDATGVVDIFKVNNKPSCITYYGGRLWVATHNIITKSKMVAYYYDEEDAKLTGLSSYKIPARVQGVTFDSTGKVYLSTSYGRDMSSYIKGYKSLINLSTRPNSPDFTIEMPPGSEELDAVDESLFIIFESAGEKYLEGTDGKGNSPAPIDKILKINIDSL